MSCVVQNCCTSPEGTWHLISTFDHYTHAAQNFGNVSLRNMTRTPVSGHVKQQRSGEAAVRHLE